MKYTLILLLLAFNSLAYDAFIKPVELKKSLNSDTLVLLDVSSQNLYKQSHITGAIHVDIAKFTDRLNPKKTIAPSKAVQKQFIKLGIHQNSDVVIYSRNTETDQLNSSYLALMLILNGFENVSILDGGYMAWVFEYNMSTTSNPSVALQDGTFTINENPNILVELSYVKENLQNTKIVDSRETSDYFGITKSPDNKAYGHIAYAKSSYYKDKFLEDLSIRSDDVLEKIFVFGLDLNKSDEVIVYGDTIFDASMNWYILYKKLGFKNAKIYEASFVQWSNSEEAPTTQYKWE